MSIVNIFTKQAPTIAGYSFDAVLEDTFEASVELTTYPVESKVRVSDHRILQPLRWSLVGAVSNNPLKPQLTDFVGGALSNLTDNPWLAGAAGLFAGWLSGGDETRASSTLIFLINLMQSGEPFSIDAGDITLNNMVITRLSRTKDAANEQGLIFVADLQELITLDRLADVGKPVVSQMRDGDPAQTAAARIVKKGQQVAKEVTDTVSKSVNSVLDGIF